MKLVRRTNDQFMFAIEPEEHDLLFQILQLYPLVPPAHQQLSKGLEGPFRDENQRMLEESLADQRRENRRHVQAMLEEPGRFRQMKEEIRFMLKRPEMEWLLQVLNDVRIGAWLALGAPADRETLELNKTNEPYLQAMEGAGFFQSHLLESLGVANPNLREEE